MPKLSELVQNLLPDGEVTARVEDIEPGETQAGKPQLVFSVVIVDGENTGKSKKFWRMLGATSIWKLADDLMNAGSDDIDMDVDDTKSALKAAAFMRNKLFRFSVGHRQYGNPPKTVQEWSVIGPANAASI